MDGPEDGRNQEKQVEDGITAEEEAAAAVFGLDGRRHCFYL